MLGIQCIKVISVLLANTKLKENKFILKSTAT